MGTPGLAQREFAEPLWNHLREDVFGTETAVRLAKQAGLVVRATFILGLPGETREDSEATIAFAKRLPLDQVRFALATPFPGTKLWEIAMAEGSLEIEDWMALSSMGGYREGELVYVPQGRDSEELKKLQRRANFSFYFRPKIMAGFVKRIRSFDELTDYARGAWGLLASLTALNVLAFVDRQLLVSLAPLLMEDLGLTRAEVGLLVGVPGGIEEVAAANHPYVPPHGSGAALYVRPFYLGIGDNVGVKPAKSFVFRIFVTPVGPYFKGGFGPDQGKEFMVSRLDRAAPNGSGHVKAGGNYACSFAPGSEAKSKGFAEALYLDPLEHRLPRKRRRQGRIRSRTFEGTPDRRPEVPPGSEIA